MKQYLTEIKRMQKLAGVLTESELTVGSTFVNKDNGQTMTIKKIQGNTVGVESDSVKGHIFVWPKDEVEKHMAGGMTNESLKVGGKIGDQVVIATDEENEMDIDDRVKSAIEKKGATIDDFAILVPINPRGEYNYDMPANQFLSNIDMFVIKKRSKLKNLNRK